MIAPTLYEWIGGIASLERLTDLFYQKVLADIELAQVFAHMGPDHPSHVAAFLAEVLGGPTFYSDRLGGHPEMVRHHLARHLTEGNRRRWINLLLDSYAELGLPSDPEFMSALVSYLEWGSRLAVLNSQTSLEPSAEQAMPRWDWGVVGGPYLASEQPNSTSGGAQAESRNDN